MATTDLGLATGERINVTGTLEEIEKILSDAARSGQSRLAWLTDADTDHPVGVNPAQVTSIRVSGSS
jgi:hypothetical protein